MFFKTLNQSMGACHGGEGIYELGQPTVPVTPIPCTQGYHVCTEDYLLEWLASRVFEVDVIGKVIPSEMKLTCEQICLKRELPFDPYEFVENCLKSIHRPEFKVSDAIEQANNENNQTALFEALAWQASYQDIDCAVQIVPKRVAQAKAFAAYRNVIDAAWELTGGEAPPYYWERIHQMAADVKRQAHDLAREKQRELLFHMLGV